MRSTDEGKVLKYFNEQQPTFLAACEKAGLKPTRRQASKWLMRKGKAFKEGRSELKCKE
jgi:hypothetical protein